MDLSLLGDSLGGLVPFLIYVGLSLGMILVYVAVYTLATAHDELALIRADNVAAAVAFGGSMLGFALPLASAAMHTRALAEFLFHKEFNRAAGRTKLAWFLLHAARYLPVRIYATDPQWGAATVANHRELVAALRDRDIDEVVRQTRRQFDDAAERLTGRLDELGLWPA